MAELVDGGVGAVTAGVGASAMGSVGCAAIASVGSGLAFTAVIDHALDDGLAKAHDIIVVDGGSGCEETIGKALLDQD